MKAQPWAVALGCLTAGTLAAAGIANAVSAPTKIPDSNTGVITACMVKKTGDVRFIDAQKGATCTKKEKKVTFNHAGQEGPAGAPGAPGTIGAPGERGPSNGYVAHRPTPLTLGELVLVGGNDIAKLTLPPGSYVLNANTSVKATNIETVSITCRLETGTGTLTDTDAVLSPTEANKNQPVALAATYTNTASGSVTLTCWPRDGVLMGLDGAGEANGGTLTAIRVAELSAA